MDKPTIPDSAELDCWEKPEFVSQAADAIRKAEEADPALRKKRQRREADLNAQYARRLGRHVRSAEEREKLIREARLYAESYLQEAHSPNSRLVVTRRIWDDIIPESEKHGPDRLDLATLHSAIWTEGLPSLEERATSGSQPETKTGTPPKRGRPQKIPDERKAAAVAKKASGGTNRDAAILIYDTHRPTDRQVKNVPSILRSYKKKISEHSGPSTS
jgi:hypothetical protein